VLLGLIACAWLVPPATAGPVAQWHFDESSGTVAADSVGYHPGTLHGTATFSDGGISGNCLSVPAGGGGYVDMGDCFAFTYGDFSVVAWIKMYAGDQTPYAAVAKHRSGQQAGYFLAANGDAYYGQLDKAYFYNTSAAGTVPISTTTVNDGTWHQVVGVYHSGGEAEIYVDGSPVERSQPSTPIASATGSFMVAGITLSDGNPGCSYEGRVDEVQLYNHALDPNEVQFLFENPSETVGGPTIAEPGWTLTRSVYFLGAFAAHYNAFDGLLYCGKRDAGPEGLYRVNADDSVVAMWTGDHVAGVVCDPNDGDIFASDDYYYGIFRTPLSGPREQWFWNYNSEPDPVGMAIMPDNYTGTIVDPNYPALVVDRDTGVGGYDQIWRWSLTTSQDGQVVHGDDGTLMDGVDITIGVNEVYVADTGNGANPYPGRVFRLNADGSLTQLTTSEELADPMGIAVDPLTQELIVLETAGGRLVRVDPATGAVSDMITGFTTWYSWAGVDITPDGSQLIVTDHGASTIYVFTREAQPEPYDVSWYTIDGGGEMYSTGDGFEVGGTIGQHDAGVMSGDGFTVAAGFWSGACFLLGDLDHSGVVNISDLAQLLANYNTTSGATYEDGDLNGDGAVTLPDLAELLAHYGDACP
jgi:hypothetical protein